MTKTIAVYERMLVNAFFNTFFNPLYWLKCLLVFILKIPFQLLDIIVSEDFGKKARQSKYSSIIKITWLVVIGFLFKILGVIADLQTLGFLTKIKDYISKTF